MFLQAVINSGFLRPLVVIFFFFSRQRRITEGRERGNVATRCLGNDVGCDVCRSVQSRLLHLGDNFSRFPLLFHNFTFYKLPNLLNRFKGRVIILLI